MREEFIVPEDEIENILNNNKTQFSVKTIFAIFSAGAAVISACVGFTIYLNEHRVTVLNDRHDAEINRIKTENSKEIALLENRINSIDRRFGEKRFIKISDLIAKNENQKRPSPESKYFNEGFYACKDIGGAQYIKRYIKGEKKQNEEGSIFNKLIKIAPMHMWLSEEKKNCHSTVSLGSYILGSYSFQGAELMMNYISLQKLPINKLKKAFLEPFIDAYIQNAVTASKITEGKKSFTDKMNSQINNFLNKDTLGILYTFFLELNFAGHLLSGDCNWEITELQKLDNIIYTQIASTFYDIEVNNKPVDELYITNEMFFIKKDNYLYFIDIREPRLEPLPKIEFQGVVKEWFSKLLLL